jgi:hypothetical protein
VIMHGPSPSVTKQKAAALISGRFLSRAPVEAAHSGNVLKRRGNLAVASMRMFVKRGPCCRPTPAGADLASP